MYIVSYDISNDKRRLKIAKELENFGVRVQYSVFECTLSASRFSELYQRLLHLMQEDEEGSIRIYHLCENCVGRTMLIGIAKESTAKEEVIVI